MVNLGLDFAFLNGRINGTFEWYNKTTKDMIWDYPVSAALYPVSTLTANAGKMRNTYFETHHQRNADHDQGLEMVYLSQLLPQHQ